MQKKQKKFIGIHFECCNVYRRIYVNRDSTAYTGNCPKCYGKVKALIGKGGTGQRFFKAR